MGGGSGRSSGSGSGSSSGTVNFFGGGMGVMTCLFGEIAARGERSRHRVERRVLFRMGEHGRDFAGNAFL